MTDVLKIAAVFIGTIVGAGLASGQEIMQFFSIYGKNGFYGIFICCLIYILLSFIIIDLCYIFRFKSYQDIIEYTFGKSCGKTATIILTFFIFSGNVIMLSGGGAMIHEYVGIDHIWGILFMSVLAFSAACYSSKGLIAVNAIIVPFSTLVIFLIGIFVIASAFHNKAFNFDPISLPISKSHEWLLSSILYAAFNLIAATGVICPLTLKFKNRKAFVKGCVLGSVVLTLLAVSISFSLLYFLPQSFRYEIPNLYVAKQYGHMLPFVLTIIIWFEMFSTEIGNIYSLSSVIQNSIHFSNTKAVISILLVSFPFTLLGFSNLIKFLYPAYGILGLLFISMCFIKFIVLKHKFH
jgi:uncharacterized membrane protein YkvI